MKIRRISTPQFAPVDANSSSLSPNLQLLFGYRDVDTSAFRNLTHHLLFGKRNGRFEKAELEFQLDSGDSIVTRFSDGLRFRNSSVQDEWANILREIDLATYELVYDKNFGQESISGSELCFQLKRRFGVAFGDAALDVPLEDLDVLEVKLNTIEAELRHLRTRLSKLKAEVREADSSELPREFLSKQRMALESRIENQRNDLDRLRVAAYQLEYEIETAVQAAVPRSREPSPVVEHQGTRDEQLERINLQVEKWKAVQQDVHDRLTDLKSELGSARIGEFDVTFEEPRTLIRESESKLIDLLEYTDSNSETSQVLKDLIAINHGICDSLSEVQDLWRDKIVESEIKDLNRCYDGLEEYLKRLTDRRMRLTGNRQPGSGQNCKCRNHHGPAKVDLGQVEKLKIQHDELLDEIEDANLRLNSAIAELDSLVKESPLPRMDLQEMRKRILSTEEQVFQLESDRKQLLARIAVAKEPVQKGSHLIGLISKYIEDLTNGVVSRLFIASDGSDFVVVDSDGEEAYSRSLGFVRRNQVRLAVSLGCAELLAEAGYSVPLVLEDVFVGMDEHEIDLAVGCFHQFSRRYSQIILLTNNRFVRDFVAGKGLPCLDLPDRYSGETLPLAPIETDRQRSFKSRIDWNEVNRRLDLAAMDQYGTEKQRSIGSVVNKSFYSDTDNSSYQSDGTAESGRHEFQQRVSRKRAANQSTYRAADNRNGMSEHDSNDSYSRSRKSNRSIRRSGHSERDTSSNRSRTSNSNRSSSQERTDYDRESSNRSGRSSSRRRSSRTYTSNEGRNRRRSQQSDSYSIHRSVAGEPAESGTVSLRRSDSQSDSRVQNADQNQAEFKFYLNLSSDVEAAPTIGPKTAERLAKIGIVTVEDLLNSDPQWVSDELNHRRIKAADVALWQQQARLVCQVPNLRGHDAQILVACGILDSQQLGTMDAKSLFGIVGPFAKSKEGQKLIRGAKEPDLAEVEDWIQWARNQRPLDQAA